VHPTHARSSGAYNQCIPIPTVPTIAPTNPVCYDCDAVRFASLSKFSIIKNSFMISRIFTFGLLASGEP
jgi:hypothetical protein